MACKKGHVPVSKEEIRIIVRSYFQHPANWPCILQDVRENLHLLPADVQHMYKEGSLQKLRRRMGDEMNKMLSLSPEKLNEEELTIQDLIVKIKDNKNSLSERKTPKERKRQNKSEDSTSEERQIFIPWSDAEENLEDEEPTGPAEPKRKSNSELAREANLEYLNFARNSLPNLMSKMEKCMDKFLNM